MHLMDQMSTRDFPFISEVEKHYQKFMERRSFSINTMSKTLSARYTFIMGLPTQFLSAFPINLSSRSNIKVNHSFSLERMECLY